MPTPSSTLSITLPTTLHCWPHDKEQQHETVTPYMGERRYWGWQRTSGEGMPAFLCNFFFFTNYFEGLWQRGGFPLLHCVSFHTNATRGVSPFSVVFLSTQTRWAGGSPSPLCFFPHRHDEEGETLPPLCFDAYRHDERGIAPSLSCYQFRCDKEEEPLPVMSNTIFNGMRRGKPLPVMLNTVSTWRGGFQPSLPCQTAFLLW